MSGAGCRRSGGHFWTVRDPQLLGTSGGVIEVDLSGPSTVRELHQGVGHGRDGAETEFLRLDHRHVLAAALGQQRAKVIDLDRWAVVNSQVEITSPWVVHIALGESHCSVGG